MHASNPNSSTTTRHFSGPPAMPTTLAPAILAICPASDPVAPAAAETTTVSPGCGPPPADLNHPEVGGGAGRAVHRHHRQLVDHAGDGRGEHVVADDHVLLKACQRGHYVANGVRVASRRHRLADPSGPDDLAKLLRREVARLPVEPRA